MCKTLIAYNDRALCRCGIRIPSAHNRRPAFDKDKYLELMFGDAGQARTNAAMLLLTIATTSSHTCTKPIVSSSRYSSSTCDVALVHSAPTYSLSASSPKSRSNISFKVLSLKVICSSATSLMSSGIWSPVKNCQSPSSS